VYKSITCTAVKVPSFFIDLSILNIAIYINTGVDCSLLKLGLFSCHHSKNDRASHQSMGKTAVSHLYTSLMVSYLTAIYAIKWQITG
jgi:hypothetical protein